MYYPKSQIKTNLYTNGDKFALASTNETYTGYYYVVEMNSIQEKIQMILLMNY